jgi:hypothetical protein
MGGKKKSIEARVLSFFKTNHLGWYAPDQLDLYPEVCGLSVAQVARACTRLAARALLVVHQTAGGGVVYRLARAQQNEHELPLPNKLLDDAVLACCTKHGPVLVTAGLIGTEIGVPAGVDHVTIEDVEAACARLVAQGKLVRRLDLYCLADRDQINDTRPSFKRASTVPLGEYMVCEGRGCMLLAKCGAALYPDGAEADFTAATLVARIKQLRVDHEKLQALFQEELAKRHKAEEGAARAELSRLEEAARAGKLITEERAMSAALLEKLKLFSVLYGALFGVRSGAA